MSFIFIMIIPSGLNFNQINVLYYLQDSLLCCNVHFILLTTYNSIKINSVLWH